jgi:Ger(x)C family germination protein
VQKQKYKFLIVILLLSLSLCGCWDSVELENRVLVLGIGVDKGEGGQFSITYQLGLPAQMAGGDGGGGEGEATLNLTEEGDNVFSANSVLYTKIDGVTDYQHLQVIVIGEEAARAGVQEFFDYFMRDYQMRRRTKVFVTRGKAKDVFTAKVKTQKSSAIYMSHLVDRNQSRSAMIMSKMDLGGLIVSTRANADYLLGLVQAEEEEIKISGAGVFKQGRLVGYLNKSDLPGVEWLRGDIKYTEVVVDNPTEKITKAVCNMGNVHTKVTPLINGDRLDFKVEIDTEGDLREIRDTNQIIYTEEEIRGIEQAVEQKITQLCLESLRILQEEYGADGLDWYRKVENLRYRFWQENKDRWDELFPQAKVDLTVKAKIRRTGLTR